VACYFFELRRGKTVVEATNLHGKAAVKGGFSFVMTYILYQEEI